MVPEFLRGMGLDGSGTAIESDDAGRVRVRSCTRREVRAAFGRVDGHAHVSPRCGASAETCQPVHRPAPQVEQVVGPGVWLCLGFRTHDERGSPLSPYRLAFVAAESSERGRVRMVALRNDADSASEEPGGLLGELCEQRRLGARDSEGSPLVWLWRFVSCRSANEILASASRLR